ncbi:MAG: histidine kinase dimerization/phospho-acceptor domain-containing protein [Blastocatellia bacterium]
MYKQILRARGIDIALIYNLALFIATIWVVLLVTRFSVLRSINDLVTGTKAFSEGDFNYRVIVPNNGGEFAHLASQFNQMANHLTEQRQKVVNAAEEQLTLERNLKQSERLATVGRLAAGIAHEMGAPLNVIKGRVDMLRTRRDVTSDRRDRWLQIIDEQVDSIARIVRQLLTLARPFHLQQQVVKHLTSSSRGGRFNSTRRCRTRCQNYYVAQGAASDPGDRNAASGTAESLPQRFARNARWRRPRRNCHLC